MNLIFCRKNVKECLDHVNKYNPVLDSPISQDELLNVAKDVFINFKEPIYQGIMFQFIDVEDDIMMICWILPHYALEPTDLDLAEFDLEMTGEEILSNAMKGIGDIVKESTSDEIDNDPRITHFDNGGKLN